MLVTVLIVFASPTLIQAAAPQVQIEQGTLSGTVLTSRNGQEFYGFYGIPYAQPPTGELRFQPPKLPPPVWQGTKNATQEPPFCPQMHAHSPIPRPESEDCLYLQVFTHNVNVTNQGASPKPVLVFIHGGAFQEGGSVMYEPGFFLDKPIVLVTVNSRLGVFGFFSAGDKSYPGNYGLKDQTAALQWIQKNIGSFGGDPSAVTLMGHSSGAASVHYHTLSPLSKGIFHRAIIQSGGANMIWTLTPTERAQRNFANFTHHANCSRSSTHESVACLLALPFKELTNLASDYKDVDGRVFPFNPVIEADGSEGAFIPSDTSKFPYPDPQIPLIFGFTSNEVLGIGMMNGMKCTDEKTFDHALLQELLFYKSESGHEELAQKTLALAKNLYFKNNFTNCGRNTTTILMSDLNFKLGILNSIMTYSINRSYAFEFDYRDTPFSKEFGVGHGAELRMLFPFNRRGSQFPMAPNERQVSEKMITYWSNFVLTGDPNTPNKTLPSEWSPAKSGEDESYRRMHITTNGFQMESEVISEEIDLWNHYRDIFWKYA